MADQYDPMKDPTRHDAPQKALIDKVIELALGAGGGAVTLLSGLLAAVLIMYSGYVLYDTFATERQHPPTRGICSNSSRKFLRITKRRWRAPTSGKSIKITGPG